MTSYLGLVGPLLASIVALYIANIGWRRADDRARDEAEAALRREQAQQLATLLEITLAGAESAADVAKMKAILLILPGHLATFLRLKLRLDYTMKDVPLDAASVARLRATAKPDAGSKWSIFDRSSVLVGRGRNHRNPFPEWVEAELAYDIAGLRGGDQDAVLAALKKDVRDPKDAATAMLLEANGKSNELPGRGDNRPK